MIALIDGAASDVILHGPLRKCLVDVGDKTLLSGHDARHCFDAPSVRRRLVRASPLACLLRLVSALEHGLLAVSRRSCARHNAVA